MVHIGDQAPSGGTNTIRTGRSALTAGSDVSSVVKSSLGYCALWTQHLLCFEALTCLLWYNLEWVFRHLFLYGEASRHPEVCRASSHSARLPLLCSQGRSRVELSLPDEGGLVWLQELLGNVP